MTHPGQGSILVGHRYSCNHLRRVIVASHQSLFFLLSLVSELFLSLLSSNLCPTICLQESSLEGLLALC
jgi:hypothetical protein